MTKIAICDDNRDELNRTRSNCLAYIGKHPETESRISMFEDPKDLLSCIELNEKFDIIFLDIYMPNITGVELAAFIRKRNERCEIIFLTSSETHAIEAFSLNATHYIVKPYTFEQFEYALDKAFSQVAKQKKAQITLKSTIGLHKVLLEDLVYAETQMHMQHIHLADGRVLKIRMTSINLYEMVEQDRRFYKCGSTYIINLEKIKEIEAKTILLDNEEKLILPRRQYKPLIDRYTLFSLKGC